MHGRPKLDFANIKVSGDNVSTAKGEICRTCERRSTLVDSKRYNYYSMPVELVLYIIFLPRRLGTDEIYDEISESAAAPADDEI